jgi:hypothetical protein
MTGYKGLMVWLKRLMLLLALLLPAPAAAQSQALAGSWALRLDGAAIMRFDLQRDGKAWKGTWVKPGSFASDGKRFGRISLPAVELPSRRGKAIGDWAELTFNDPDAGSQVFRFRVTGPDKVEMLYVDTGLAPFTLVRVAAGAPLGPFEEGKVYGASALPRDAGPSPPQEPAFEGR